MRTRLRMEYLTIAFSVGGAWAWWSDSTAFQRGLMVVRNVMPGRRLTGLDVPSGAR